MKFSLRADSRLLERGRSSCRFSVGDVESQANQASGPREFAGNQHRFDLRRCLWGRISLYEVPSLPQGIGR